MYSKQNFSVIPAFNDDLFIIVVIIFDCENEMSSTGKENRTAEVKRAENLGQKK